MMCLHGAVVCKANPPLSCVPGSNFFAYAPLLQLTCCLDLEQSLPLSLLVQFVNRLLAMASSTMTTVEKTATGREVRPARVK